jgi:hypothetical protein
MDMDPPGIGKSRIWIRWGNDKYKKYKNIFIFKKKLQSLLFGAGMC